MAGLWIGSLAAHQPGRMSAEIEAVIWQGLQISGGTPDKSGEIVPQSPSGNRITAAWTSDKPSDNAVRQ
jgi:hypothetical protein